MRLAHCTQAAACAAAVLQGHTAGQPRARFASLPPERVSAMQRTIATHAHQLVYGLGPRGLPGDAIDTLFSIMQTAVSITPP